MKVLRTTLMALVIFVALAGLAQRATAQTSAAPPSVQTVPAANQTVSASPAELKVTPPGSATAGIASIYNARGKEIAHGRLAPAGGTTLGLHLPKLADGSYLATWRAGGDAGSFGFGVSATGSPRLVTQPKTTAALGPLQDNLVGWAPLTLVMLLAGALGLRLLVSAPAARRTRDPQALVASDRRLTQFAAVTVALLVPVEVVSFAYSDGQWDFGSIWPALGADGAGHVMGARIALCLLAAACLLPFFLRRRPTPAWATGAALGCALVELVGREVPTAVPPDWPRTIVNTVFYCFHLFAASFWIGGLAGLLVLLFARGIPARSRTEFWPLALRRFSVTATVSVGVLVLTGLWLFWVHVSGLHQLLNTLYGQTLLVKLVVVVVLVGIGASNQLWLVPLLDNQAATSDRRGLNRTVAVHVRSVIAIEVALALGVVFIAALLGGSARNQAFQASPQALGQTETSGAATVSLVPSGMQPGLTDYNVTVRGLDPKSVVLQFKPEGLATAPLEATATTIADGTWRVTGYYTPVAATWNIGVRLDHAQAASFPFPVTIEAPTPGKAPAPPVRWTTWVAGVLETLLVAGALASCYRLSRRLASPPLGPSSSTLQPA